MELPSWMPRDIRIPPSVKFDISFLIPTLFFFNVYLFSSWGNLLTWEALLVPLIYGFLGLLPLVWRNEAPLPVFITQLVHAVVADALPFIREEYVPVAGILLALYAITVHHSSKISVPALVVSLAANELGAIVIFRVSHYDPPVKGLQALFGNVVFLAMVTGGAWAAGRKSFKVKQQHVGRLEREHARTLKAQARTLKAEVVAEERRRIARELHDIVSHSVAVVALQANGATSIADTDFTKITNIEFSRIKQALGDIATTSTQTMDELRRLLEVLEMGELTRDAVGISELGPQPGLTDLPKLLNSLRATGRPVTVQVEGTPRDLDPSVDLTAYRIVQEGLTNVLKHAGKDANPRLCLIWSSQSLRIQIDNDTHSAEAPRASTPSVGRGLVGLRERAHAIGGELTAAPRHEGGYRLIASLPLSTPEVSPTSGQSSRPHEDQGKVST